MASSQANFSFSEFAERYLWYERDGEGKAAGRWEEG
jgi:hypothetical protein